MTKRSIFNVIAYTANVMFVKPTMFRTRNLFLIAREEIGLNAKH